jgi:DNA-binding beta-propeller fold protein YncE
MPNIKGRIDHMEVDVRGRRLFVAALENGSVEVIDLRKGKWSRNIPGFQSPQGITYLLTLNKLFVANENDDSLRVFQGNTLALIDTICLDKGGNRIAYDPRSGNLYVGYGGRSAKKDYGEIGIIDPRSDRRIGDIRVGIRPAEILIDKSGGKLFVFDSIANQIQLIDPKTRQIIFTWPVNSQRPGDAAFDEASHRLFFGTRTPAEMIVIDSDSGNIVADLPTVEGMDGVYFDARRKRIYVSGGRDFEVGAVFVYEQQSADHYTQLGQVPTRAGAGTSLWSPELNRLYVAAPTTDKEAAAILVFKP